MLMEIGTKDNGKTIKGMVRVILLGKMAISIKESTKTITNMALEFLPILMENYIKENGKKIKTMVRVYILGKMATAMKEST